MQMVLVVQKHCMFIYILHRALLKPIGFLESYLISIIFQFNDLNQIHWLSRYLSTMPYVSQSVSVIKVLAVETFGTEMKGRRVTRIPWHHLLMPVFMTIIIKIFWMYLCYIISFVFNANQLLPRIFVYHQQHKWAF